MGAKLGHVGSTLEHFGPLKTLHWGRELSKIDPLKKYYGEVLTQHPPRREKVRLYFSQTHVFKDPSFPSKSSTSAKHAPQMGPKMETRSASGLRLEPL